MTTPSPGGGAAPAATAGAQAVSEDGAAPLVSVIIPAFNEEATVEHVIRLVTGQPLRIEAIVVDDGSHDGTAAVLERLVDGSLPGLRVIRHPANRGKSAAVRTGIEESRGAIVAIQDADLEYDPRDLPRLVAPIVEGHADVVYGSRLRGGQPQRAHLFWHYVGNRFLSLLTNVLYNTTISDMEVGYKVFKGDLIRSLPLVSEGFGFEPEVTAKLLRRGDVRLYEIPVSYYGRTYAEGKKITWRDGVKAVALLMRFRFMR
jgi:glycosyltransferase involved in cell wall biosynthesis